ncbi:MAG: DNA polymerase IV [Clostridia bacterium]|nr:DNA polymerase IV [Clostridia bacterium]
MSDRVILHCDLNNFYASAECVMNPALHNYPVAVAGNPKTRHGIILAKNQKAKDMGIKTGQVIWEAKQLCPNLICLPPQMSKYQEFSRQVIEIYKRFTDKIESFGPDECWLDVTHSQLLFGTGEQIANKIRQTVKQEIGLTLSVGVSFNKYFAKLGSDMRKPDATTVISRQNFKELIWNMPADVLIFIGKRTYQKLQKLNVHTIQDLALIDPDILTKHFGVIGKKMSVIARGEDDSDIADISDIHTVKSVGNGFTTIRDLHTRDEIYTAVLLLAEKVAYRMRKINVVGKTINLGLKNSDLHWDSHSMTILTPTDTALEIANYAMQIFDKFWHNTPLNIRSIRVSLSQITNATSTTQANFFDDAKMKKIKNLNPTLDKIREKHGYYAVRSAKTIDSDFINYFDASKELGEDYELYDLDES